MNWRRNLLIRVLGFKDLDVLGFKDLDVLKQVVANDFENFMAG